MSKSKRGGKIFVDYLRNGRGASAILPFSFRARPGNPIALPLTWDQIGTPGNEWTLDAVKRHKMVKDPWQSTVGPQSLTKAVKRYL
jgi:bifunctional non-homologous end joining protein LigD